MLIDERKIKKELTIALEHDYILKDISHTNLKLDIIPLCFIEEEAQSHLCVRSYNISKASLILSK